MSKKEEKKDLIALTAKILCLGPRIISRAAQNVVILCDEVIDILEYFE